MRKKILKIIFIIIGIFVGIILLDTIQALVFNNNVIFGIETKCMRKQGIIVDTYHCGNGNNKTRLKKSNECYYEDVCGKKINDDLEIKENDVLLDIKNKTLSSKGATLILKNNTSNDYVYGPDYYIEVQENGKWIEKDTITGDPLVWNAMAYILKSNEEKEINVDWTLAYGELPSGQYRLVKKVFKEEDRPIDDSKILYLYTEFSIDADNSAKLEPVKAKTQNTNKYNVYLEKDNKIIYLSSAFEEIYYVNGNNKITLKNYISKSYQTMNDSIKNITNLLDYVDTYKDGGSILYKSSKYDIALLKCHTLDGNTNIYIGDYSMNYEQNMCK